MQLILCSIDIKAGRKEISDRKYQEGHNGQHTFAFVRKMSKKKSRENVAVLMKLYRRDVSTLVYTAKRKKPKTAPKEINKTTDRAHSFLHSAPRASEWLKLRERCPSHSAWMDIQAKQRQYDNPTCTFAIRFS